MLLLVGLQHESQQSDPLLTFNRQEQSQRREAVSPVKHMQEGLWTHDDAVLRTAR
jgi:hypothetical protein